MAFRCGFFNSLDGDRKYNAMDMSRLFNGIIRDGVFMSIGTQLMVTAYEGMIVNVGIGRAWFNGTWSDNDAIMPLRHEPCDILLNRIDAVVLDVNINDNYRINEIKIIKGEESSKPVRPTLIKEYNHYQYPLAYVSIKGTAEAIVQADITNMVGTSETPFVTGVLETMDIDALIAQWGSQWEVWKQNVEADNTQWTSTKRAEYEEWVEQQETDAENWVTDYKDGLEDFRDEYTSDLLSYKNASEQDFIDWFENLQAQLDTDTVTHLQGQINTIVEKEFARYYEMVTKVTDIIRNGEGKTEKIVATCDDATATTTFGFTEEGNRIITTVIVPTEGNWDYTKTVIFTKTDTATHIDETVVRTPKETITTE